MALPFVQGRLRGEHLTALVSTECAHCRQPMHIEVDSDLKYRVAEADARPLVFAPLSVVKRGAPSIIDGF
jgi:hypothetical protein